MDHSTPDFPVHHQLPEFTQTHVHWVGDAIQPSHPLSSTSPPAFNLSQHQGHFQWVSSSCQVANGASALTSVLPMNIWDWFPLGLTSFVSVDIFPKSCPSWQTSKRLYHVVYPCLSPVVISSFQMECYFYSYSLGEYLHLIKDEI